MENVADCNDGGFGEAAYCHHRHHLDEHSTNFDTCPHGICVAARRYAYQVGRAADVVRDGVSLRNYFAAKAMQVILHPANERIYDEKEIAEAAFSMADAMLLIGSGT